MALLRPGAFWRNVNPSGAFTDLVLVIRDAGPRRWPMAAIAALTTILVFWPITHEHARGLPRPPKIIYISTFHAGRTDAEIAASNLAHQRWKDAQDAEAAADAAAARHLWKVVGRVSGFDVEAMDRQARADAAADARKAAAEQAALYGAGHVTAATVPAPDVAAVPEAPANAAPKP